MTDDQNIQRPPEAAPPLVDCGIARKRFSSAGLSAVVILAAGTAGQLLLMLPIVFSGQLASSTWYLTLASYLPMYVAAYPACYAVLRCIPAGRLEKRPMRAKGFFICLLMCIGVLYVGNYVGIGVMALLNLAFGQSAANPLLGLVDATSLPVRFLFMVICAPLFEEFIFRKQMLDRLHRYGEGISILISALLFGLIHGNFSQLFYAFGLGLLFGYIYTRTGTIWYTVALHAVVNFLGGIVAPWVSGLAADGLDFSAASPAEWIASLGAGIYSLAMLAAMVAGIVLLIVRRKHFTLRPTEAQLPKGMVGKTAFRNVGMLLAVILLGLVTIFQSCFMSLF